METHRNNLAVVVTAVCLLTTCFAADPNEKKIDAGFQIQTQTAQTVLYTVYRGPYEQCGQAISELFALAGKNQVRPIGALTFAYLNNPTTVKPQHLLTEIRIPVSGDTLKLQGTLGAMTDVKEIPEMKVVIAKKPAGTEDPSQIYSALTKWVYEHGYMVVDSPIEQMGMVPNYKDMETTIALPIERVQK